MSVLRRAFFWEGLVSALRSAQKWRSWDKVRLRTDIFGRFEARRPSLFSTENVGPKAQLWEGRSFSGLIGGQGSGAAQNWGLLFKVLVRVDIFFDQKVLAFFRGGKLRSSASEARRSKFDFQISLGMRRRRGPEAAACKNGPLIIFLAKKCGKSALFDQKVVLFGHLGHKFLVLAH